MPYVSRFVSWEELAGYAIDTTNLHCVSFTASGMLGEIQAIRADPFDVVWIDAALLGIMAPR